MNIRLQLIMRQLERPGLDLDSLLRLEMELLELAWAIGEPVPPPSAVDMFGKEKLAARC